MYATTRSPDTAAKFSESGLHPLVLDITDEPSVKQLKAMEFDTVVVAVGMDRKRYDSVHQVYVGGLENVLINLSDDTCLLYTSPSPRDRQKSRMPSSA